jgi:hypothetical protein
MPGGCLDIESRLQIGPHQPDGDHEAEKRRPALAPEEIDRLKEKFERRPGLATVAPHEAGKRFADARRGRMGHGGFLPASRRVESRRVVLVLPGRGGNLTPRGTGEYHLARVFPRHERYGA